MIISLTLAFNVLEIANSIDSCIVHDISYYSAFDSVLYYPECPCLSAVCQQFKYDFFQEITSEPSSWTKGLSSEFPSAIIINIVPASGVLHVSECLIFVTYVELSSVCICLLDYEPIEIKDYVYVIHISFLEV